MAVLHDVTSTGKGDSFEYNLDWYFSYYSVCTTKRQSKLSQHALAGQFDLWRVERIHCTGNCVPTARCTNTYVNE